MANLLSGTLIGPTTKTSIQKAFYAFNTTNTTPEYIHMKTNVSGSLTNTFYIEAEGYNYGVTLPILCSWSGSISTSSLLSSVKDHYTGMSAHGCYKSSDGYLVIRAYSTNNYYNGFILTSYVNSPSVTYRAAAGVTMSISILAAAQVSNSGNYY